jgi:hypothetical protein
MQLSVIQRLCPNNELARYLKPDGGRGRLEQLARLSEQPNLPRVFSAEALRPIIISTLLL